ncbi:MAG: hypothetical protein ACQERD_01855 [Campylobacterota bacterium]
MIKIINFFFYIFWIIAFGLFLYFGYRLVVCNSTEIAAPFGILLSALLASTAVLKTISKSQEVSQKKEKYDKSEFYMNKSIEGLNQVFELLKDLNNNRVVWIQAARVLDKTLELSNFITEENHKKVFELQRFMIKNNLSKLFNEVDGQSYGLPLSFFAGLENWKNEKDSEAINELKRITIQNQLNPESVIAIFKFLKFEDDYVDPLDDNSVPLNDNEAKRIAPTIPAIKEYLGQERLKR